MHAMVGCNVKIENSDGLHARPAANVMKEAKRYKADIRITKGERTGNAKSVVEIMTLDISCGDTVWVSCSGESEQEALLAMKQVMESMTDS